MSNDCIEFPFQKTPNHFTGSKSRADIPYYEITGRSGCSTPHSSAQKQGRGKRSLFITPGCCWGAGRRDGADTLHTQIEVDKGSRASLIALAGAKPPGAGCCWMSLWVCTRTSRACPRKPAGEGHAGGSAARIAHTPPFPSFAYISSRLL